MKIVVDKIVNHIDYDETSAGDDSMFDNPQDKEDVKSGKIIPFGVWCEAFLIMKQDNGGYPWQEIGSVRSAGLWGIFIDKNSSPKKDDYIRKNVEEQSRDLAEIIKLLNIKISKSFNIETKVDY